MRGCGAVHYSFVRHVTTVCVASVFAAATLALSAQVSIDPAHPRPIADILTWRGDEQARGFRAIEKIFKVETVRRGATVHALPVARTPITPGFEYAGRAWTIDDYMRAYRVSGLLVLRDGKILLEKYGLGRGPRDRWTSFSVAKSITSALVGAAIRDGAIRSLDDPITRYIAELRGSAYEGVTIRQMLTMNSGVAWNEDYTDPASDVARAGAVVTEPGVNPMVSYLRKLPRAQPPGRGFHYNTGETDLVGVLVAKATGKPLSQYLSERIWAPYGMEQDAIWMTDPGSMERGGCCLSMTLRDYGRFGQFMLDNGVARGRTVLPDGWVAQATRKQVPIDPADRDGAGYGYFWWVPTSGRYDAFGIFGQSITTFPADRLIVVQNAAWPAATGAELSAARNAMLAAVRSASAR